MHSPPKKYLHAYSNQRAWIRSAPGSGLVGFEHGTAGRLAFNTAGTKTSQLGLEERRTNANGNFTQSAGAGAQAVPSATPWRIANAGETTAGSTNVDNYEANSTTIGGTSWAASWISWVRTERLKSFALAQVTRNGSEYVSSPGFILQSPLIGSGSDGHRRSKLRIAGVWDGTNWTLVGFWTMQEQNTGSGPLSTLRVRVAAGNQYISSAAAGDVVSTLQAGAGSSTVTRWFSLVVPPDNSVLFNLAIAGETAGDFPTLYGTLAEMQDAGFNPWIYLPVGGSAIDSIYSEGLGSEDTIEAGLLRTLAATPLLVTVGHSLIATTTSVAGGTTAESYNPITGNARTTKLTFTFPGLTIGHRYRVSVTLRDNTTGDTDYTTSVDTSLEFVAGAVTDTAVLRVVAPVGKDRTITAVSTTDLGADATSPAVGTPVIYSLLTAAGTAAAAFAGYTILAYNTPTSYGATGLPTGLSVSSSTGVISGTPTQSGTFNVTISATNATGTGSATLVMTIAAEPAITGSDFAAADLAAAYGLRRLVTGYTGNLFRLRRVSDNVEQDFAVGYLKSEVNAFIGASTARIVTLYDQTGNGHTKTQATTARQSLIEALAPSTSYFAAKNSTSDQSYWQEAATLTSRAVVAVIQNSSGSNGGAGLVCNAADENVEIRRDFYGATTWEQLNYGTSTFVNGVSTTTFSLGAWHVARFQATADKTFANPHNLYTSKTSNNRYFNGHLAEILFVKSTGDAAAMAATLKTFWGL